MEKGKVRYIGTSNGSWKETILFSIWDLDLVKEMIEVYSLDVVTFPQCMWGVCSSKNDYNSGKRLPDKLLLQTVHSQNARSSSLWSRRDRAFQNEGSTGLSFPDEQEAGGDPMSSTSSRKSNWQKFSMDLKHGKESFGASFGRRGENERSAAVLRAAAVFLGSFRLRSKVMMQVLIVASQLYSVSAGDEDACPRNNRSSLPQAPAQPRERSRSRDRIHYQTRGPMPEDCLNCDHQLTTNHETASRVDRICSQCGYQFCLEKPRKQFQLFDCQFE